jgi:hypothetical protein
MADQQWYDEGLRPKVLINWDSFEQWGLPSSWKGPFTDAVINAYTRWMNVAGVDLRFQFWGYTTKTSSDSGELVISMNEKHATSWRLASTFGSYNKLIVVFHRKAGANDSPWNFVPYNAQSGEYDMYGILLHELGHCLGLDHSSPTTPTIMGSYDYFARFGPYAGDVADAASVFSRFDENRLRQLRSTDGGSSWSPVSNDLTTSGSAGTRTNLNPGVAATPESGLYLVGWSRPSRSPTWLRGDGGDFLFRRWFFYGGERSAYGPAYASDDDCRMLWAWVDEDLDIKLVGSDSHGADWYWRSTPEGATTYGTPGLAWTRAGGRSTWILTWANYDRGDRDATGHVMASVSTNHGRSWSEPTALSTFYKALSGVSVAADRDNHVVVGFSWAPHGTYGTNRIRTFDCEVSGGDLVHRRTTYGTETTRIQPALAYDEGEDHFLMAWRGQNFATTLNVTQKPTTGGTWSNKVHLSGTRSHVAPALAYSPEHDETVLWYAYEGN